MVYQFSRGTLRRIKTPDPHLPTVNTAKPVDEDPPMGMIQGQLPASKAEWRVHLALTYILKLDFIYQWTINGGRVQAGGQLVDFMIMTKPLMTPMWPEGSYWHDGSNRLQDEFKYQQVQQIYAGRIMPNVIIKSELITSARVAAMLLRREGIA
jgi:hypothetical protein